MIAVSIAVNPYLVAAGDDLPQPARVALYLFSSDKESSSRLGPFHKVEERVESSIRPIVKSQRYRVGRLKANDPREQQAHRPTPPGSRG